MSAPQAIRADDLSDDELRAVFAKGIESSDWNDLVMDVYDNYGQP